MNEPNNSDFEQLTRTQVLVVMGVTALFLLIIAKVWNLLGNVTVLEWSLDINSLLLGLAIAVGISIASTIMYWIWPDYRSSANFYLELVIKPLILPDIIWLGLLPGLSEELLFRGVMLPAFGFNSIGLILSSIIFGLVHMSGVKQWPYAVWATVVGLVLGYTALVTGNLLIPIVAHIITNLISGLVWKTVMLAE